MLIRLFSSMSANTSHVGEYILCHYSPRFHIIIVKIIIIIIISIIIIIIIINGNIFVLALLFVLMTLL